MGFKKTVDTLAGAAKYSSKRVKRLRKLIELEEKMRSPNAPMNQRLRKLYAELDEAEAEEALTNGADVIKGIMSLFQ